MSKLSRRPRHLQTEARLSPVLLSNYGLHDPGFMINRTLGWPYKSIAGLVTDVGISSRLGNPDPTMADFERKSAIDIHGTSLISPKVSSASIR